MCCVADNDQVAKESSQLWDQQQQTSSFNSQNSNDNNNAFAFGNTAWQGQDQGQLNSISNFRRIGGDSSFSASSPYGGAAAAGDWQSSSANDVNQLADGYVNLQPQDVNSYRRGLETNRPITIPMRGPYGPNGSQKFFVTLAMTP